MMLKVQRRLAAQLMKCSEKRVWFDEDRLEDIKEAITKADIRSLIGGGVIQEKPVRSISKGRTRKKKTQKRKGRSKGHGSRKGKKTARLPKKKAWMGRVRVQREFLGKLKGMGLVEKKDCGDVYRKIKGGFFRNKRHLKIYLEERNLIKKVK